VWLVRDRLALFSPLGFCARPLSNVHPSILIHIPYILIRFLSTGRLPLGQLLPYEHTFERQSCRHSSVSFLLLLLQSIHSSFSSNAFLIFVLPFIRFILLQPSLPLKKWLKRKMNIEGMRRENEHQRRMNERLFPPSFIVL
jgi:hypothetical protein